MSTSSSKTSHSGRKTAIALAVVVAIAVAAKARELLLQPAEAEYGSVGAIALDTPAPAFELKRRDGSAVRLSDLRGKRVFINFWATWCESCRYEMPSMEELAARFADRGIVFLAATVDDGWGPVDEFLEGRKFHFEVVHDAGAKWAQAFGTSKFPETYLIGPDGRIEAKFIGPRDWNDPAFEIFFARRSTVTPGAAAPAVQQRQPEHDAPSADGLPAAPKAPAP